MAERWFGVRCVFLHQPDVYEERVTVWPAADAGAAIVAAEAEAQRYAEAPGVSYLGLAQCFHMFAEPGPGAEVFSLMRESSLAPSAYLDSFFDTGLERQAAPVTEPGP